MQLLLATLAVCIFVPATASAASKPLSQYVHEEWGSEKGFPGGPINAISQTPDGYLWIGTQKGLVRFDGRNFRLYSQVSANSNPMGPVLGLVVDGEGNLWVRLQGPGLLRYRNGNFDNFSNTFDRAEIAVTQMSRAADGRPIFAGVHNGMIAFDHGQFTRIARSPDLPNFIVTSIAPGPEGTYWIGTRDLGLFQLRDGKFTPRRDASAESQINVLLSTDADELWIGTEKGLFLWRGTELTRMGEATSLRERQILSLAKDDEGSIWVGTDHGMYRLDPESGFTPKTENTLGSDPVAAVFTDREGNMWAASESGLQHLRNTVFTTYGATEGLPEESNGPIYVDSDGRTWFAPIQGGLYWLKDTRIGTVRQEALDKDVIYSIAGSNRDLWVGRQRGGLTHLENVAGKWRGTTYTTDQGLVQNSVYSVRISRNGVVWAGSLSAGLTRIKNGKLETITTANGLISNTISSILESRDSTMWFATPRGLSAFSNNRWRSYSGNDGLPSDDVNCLFEDSEGTLWIGTMKGLAALQSGKIWAPAQAPDTLREPIFGIQADANGFLWISTSNHVVRISREKLLQQDLNQSDIRQFTQADGLRNTDGVKRDEAVASDNSGRIWFSLNRGLSVVDTNRLRRESPPSILHLEGLLVDGSPALFQGSASISPNPRRVTFNYAGISLSVPGRVRFKYKLDGFDPAWSDTVTAREASYTNLAPGLYLFRVIASNSDGVWNGKELTVPFTIDRAFWQTTWFRTSFIVSLLLFVWFAHRYRVRRLTHQLSMRLEERVNERTRIARELHDTLLQSFQGVLLKFSATTFLLPDHPTEAQQSLETTIEEARQAITEGRDAVCGLRSSTITTNDLAGVLRTLGEDLAAQQSNGFCADFRVCVEGTRRNFAPLVCEEVHRVAAEALRNAFRHAQAKSINVEICYHWRQFRLRVRDDGKGIVPKILSEGGRAGHYGLRGMHERARQVGGKLAVWSELDAGTEAVLTIPAAAAYAKSTAERRPLFFRRGA